MPHPFSKRDNRTRLDDDKALKTSEQRVSKENNLLHRNSSLCVGGTHFSEREIIVKKFINSSPLL